MGIACPHAWTGSWFDLRNTAARLGHSGGQVAVDAKSNEIPAVRELPKAFTDLAGAVITVDALHTQSDTAQAITGRGAGDVMTVKANMPTLYKQLKKLPWTAIPATSAVSTGHGRRARRTIKAVLGAGLDRVRRRRPGRAGPPHGHEERQEDRRGRVPHYQRPRRRSRHPGGLGPRPPGDRKPASLGPRHPARSLDGSSSPIMVRDHARTIRDAPAELQKLLVLFSQQVAWPSACCAWTARPASPPLIATTPATRSGR